MPNDTIGETIKNILPYRMHLVGLHLPFTVTFAEKDENVNNLF